jgi:hypothetical protein
MWNFLSSKEEKKTDDKNSANLKAELAALGLEVDTSFMDHEPDDIPKYDGV